MISNEEAYDWLASDLRAASEQVWEAKDDAKMLGLTDLVQELRAMSVRLNEMYEEAIIALQSGV